MKQLIKAINTVNQIKEASKTNDKINIIKENRNNKIFLYFLNVGFNPFINTHLKKLPDYKPATDDKYLDTFNSFKDFINYSSNTNRSNDLLEKFYNFISFCGKEHTLYSELITKSLKIGISVKTINKALGFEYIPDTSLMKAYDFHKVDKIDFPCYLEEKLDGVRCIIIKDGKDIKAYTYNGSVLQLDYIFNDIRDIRYNGVYDGELLASNRQKTSGIVNQIINNNYKNQVELKYHIFDFIKLDDFYDTGDKNKLWERKQNLTYLNIKNYPYLQEVNYHYIKEINEVWSYFNKIRDNNGEGVMLKQIDSLYQRKRSKDWIKVKNRNSVTLKVKDVKEGNGKYKNKIGILVCETEDKLLSLNVGSGLSDEDRDKDFNFWLNKIVEIEYTDAYYHNNDIVIDFPRFKTIRADKDKADTLKELIITKENK